MFSELLKAFMDEANPGNKFSFLMQMAAGAATFEELETAYECALTMHNGIAKQAVLTGLTKFADNGASSFAERLEMWQKILRLVPEKTSASCHAQKKIDCLKRTIAQAELNEQRKIPF